MEKPKFTVIRDTREKVGVWDFSESASIAETIERKLDTGDYSILGLEHILCIERKKSVAEFATNVNQPRFAQELKRMEKFPYKYIICEFPMSRIIEFPEGSGIPFPLLNQIKLSPQYFMRRVSEIQVINNINIIFAGSVDNGKYAAGNIMKRVYELYEK